MAVEEADPPVDPDFDIPFHRHLDVCARCEQQPFNLCPEGEKLLKLSAMPMVHIMEDPRLSDDEKRRKAVELLREKFGPKT